MSGASRRSVLGGLFAAPTALKSAASQGPGFSAGSIMPEPEGFYANTRKDYIKDQIARLRTSLAEIDQDRPAKIREALYAVSRLDPDLDAARSFSLATKIRLQAERDVDRGAARQKTWMQRQIENYLGGAR